MMYSIDEGFQEIIKKCEEEKRDLLRKLDDLKEEDELENAEKSEKITTLQAQISDYRMRIRRQQQELSRPFPKFDDSLSRQLQLVREEYIKIARQRQQMINHSELDEYENKYLKDLDKLHQFKLVQFPFINYKHTSTFNENTGFLREVSDVIGPCQIGQEAKYQTQIMYVKNQIAVLEDDISELEGLLKASRKEI